MRQSDLTGITFFCHINDPPVCPPAVVSHGLEQDYHQQSPAISMDFKANKNSPELPPPHFDYFPDIAADHFG